MSENLVTVKEACEQLSLSASSFYRLVNAGQLELLKIGRASRVPTSSIERFVSELREAA